MLISEVFNKDPAKRLDLDLLGSGRGGCVSMMCWVRIEEDDDHNKKCKVLSII